MTTKSKMSVLAGAALIALAVPGTIRAQTTDLALVFKLLDAQRATVTSDAGGRTATLGDRLDAGEVVSTDNSTRAAIKFSDDGSLVRLNPSSQLTVTAEGEDRQSLVKTLEMDFGELWARVTSSNADNPTFLIQTPSGVAAVKGTEFIVRVDPALGTTVITLEGVVEFFNNAGTVDVTAGNVVQVPTADDAPTPRDLEPEDIGAAQQLIEDDAADDDTVSVEITVQDANGRTRTLMIDMPADQARAILGGGE